MSEEKRSLINKISHWLRETDNKTVLNQILINFLDKLLFATLAALLGFIFNSQLGNQNLIGDYQKEIFVRRQNGYIEVLNQLQSVDSSLALHIGDDIFDSSQTRLMLKRLEIKAKGYDSTTGPNHQQSLNGVLEQLDQLISITENYEIYFPDIFVDRINAYTIDVIDVVNENEKQIKRLRDNTAATNEEVRDDTVIRSKLAGLIALRNEITNLIRTRLKIEGIVLG